MDITQYFDTVGQQARAAARRIAQATTGETTQALALIASALDNGKAAILAATQEVPAAANKNRLHAALLDRLALTPDRFNDMVEGLEQIQALAAPVGEF